MIAATRRLARWLRREYDQRRLASGQTAWRPLDVLHWNAWVDRSWQRLRDHGDGAPFALSEEQERLVWEQAVRESSGSLDRLLMPREIAREASRAWHLLAEYRVDRDDLLRIAGPETRQLVAIAIRVERRLRDEGWCGPGQRQARLTEDPGLANVAAGGVLLAGFDELTPAQRTLVAALEAAGVNVGRLAAPRQDSPTRVLSCPDPHTELSDAAVEARRWLEARRAIRIGVVVPELERYRPDVEEIFDDVLDPGRILPGASSGARPWGMSLGGSLSQWPVVECALRLLSLLFREIVFTDLGLLLRSTFVGGIGELTDRGLLDGWLREQGLYRTDLGGIVGMLDSTADRRRPAVPDLADRLRRLKRFCRGLPRKAPPDRWALIFGEALGILGWPGDRTLDSTEFQCVDKWHQLLSELASTSRVTGSLAGTACLDQLGRLAADTTFQPESGDPPVQVLGLLETPGLSFDAIWIAGMHHLAWPRPVHPNALIPASLQRALRMPRSCPEVELEFARRRMSALAGSAAEVVFSWPVQIEDEPLRPSPLLNEFDERGDTTTEWMSMARLQLGSAPLERLEDYRIHPLDPGTRARGGSAIVRWQSACPFQAQARSRLGARSLEQPGPGVSAADSGSIAHLALQWLWEDWRDSSRLVSMGPDARAAAVQDVAGRACRLVLVGRGDFADSVADLERRRVTARILTLLDQDLVRAPFAILALERRTISRVEDVEFSLRIDRIDRLEDGALLLIDYKTGSVRVSDWHGERPRDPQLPFYAVAEVSGAVRGIAYGCLRVGEEGYSGYAAVDVKGTGVQDVADLKRPPEEVASWRNLVEKWEQRLQALVREFAGGDARVDPRSVAQDCRYCDLAPLCRRHELAIAARDQND